jgi:hypothetical protein
VAQCLIEHRHGRLQGRVDHLLLDVQTLLEALQLLVHVPKLSRRDLRVGVSEPLAPLEQNLELDVRVVGDQVPEGRDALRPSRIILPVVPS